MVEEVYKITWDQNALDQLADIYDYISEDSIQNAQVVRRKILDQTTGLAKNPWRYNSDKIKVG